MTEEAALERNWSYHLMRDWKALYYASAEDGMKTYLEQNSTQEIIHSHSINSENLLEYIDHPSVPLNELHSNGIAISPLNCTSVRLPCCFKSKFRLEGRSPGD